MTLEWASTEKEGDHHDPSEQATLLRSKTLPVLESLAWFLMQAAEVNYCISIQVQRDSGYDYTQSLGP